MNSSRSFLKRLMIVYMILLVGVALTNYIIDPYFCYRESSMEKYFSWDQRYSPSSSNVLVCIYLGSHVSKSHSVPMDVNVQCGTLNS